MRHVATIWAPLADTAHFHGWWSLGREDLRSESLDIGSDVMFIGRVKMGQAHMYQSCPFDCVA